MSINIPENKPIASASKKLPCVILVDTSGSMAPEQKALQDGVEELRRIIQNNEKAVSSVEISIITFDNHARVAEVFGPVTELNVPAFNCNGMTAMHDAVKVGLEVIHKRRKEYKETGVSAYRPWMYLLTDGGANDDDNGSFDDLLNQQKEKKITFFPVAIGEMVDKNLLGSLREDHLIFSIDPAEIVNAFKWLSDSLVSVSSVGPDDKKATLPDPDQYKLETEHIQVDVD